MTDIKPCLASCCFVTAVSTGSPLWILTRGCSCDGHCCCFENRCLCLKYNESSCSCISFDCSLTVPKSCIQEQLRCICIDNQFSIPPRFPPLCNILCITCCYNYKLYFSVCKTLAEIENSSIIK